MMLNVIVRLIRISLICWIALFTSLFSSRLLAQEPFAPEPLVFSTIPNNPYAPLGIDVMTEAYQQLGRTITVIEYPSARALDLANRGIVDGELGRAGLTQEKYGDLVKIPVPLLTLNMVAFTKSLHFEVNGWESLRSLPPYQLGILNGNQMVEGNLKLSNKMIIVESPEQLLAMLMKDRIQVAAIEHMVGSYALHKLATNQISELSPPIDHFKIYHFLNKKHADLVPKISAALEQIVKSGRFAELYSLHMSKIMKEADPETSTP